LASILAPIPDHARDHGKNDALIRRVAALPPRQRTVIALRFFNDRSDAEIADMLNCSVSTVRSSVSRTVDAGHRLESEGEPRVTTDSDPSRAGELGAAHLDAESTAAAQAAADLRD